MAKKSLKRLSEWLLEVEMGFVWGKKTEFLIIQGEVLEVMQFCNDLKTHPAGFRRACLFAL